MRTDSRLVDKVWILALVFTAPFFLFSCGGGEELPELDPEQIIAAADSANNALNGKLAVMRDSTNKPSLFFDTLYGYYASARMIEVQKRIDADSLSRAAVLAIHNVKDQPLRQNGLRTLSAFLQRDSLREAKLDSLRASLNSLMGKLLDSTALTPDERQGVIGELTTVKRFEPEYRRELDSLTHGTVQVELEILQFMEEASRRIRFEEVLKFTDANDLARYQSLTTRLGELAAAQQVLVDRITYGIQPVEDTSAVDTTSPKAQPRAQSWPDAVRVQ
ncbi:MAG TPA: hypothetical protein VFH43_05230 [Candidatus Kapabacteria bacterium]|nr:hypothetical protein [Candidatus Kapabacteria bacterium]